jgi:hypothetical protein
MKKLALLIAVALLALTVPAAAAEVSEAVPEAAPVAPVQQQIGEPLPLLLAIGPAPVFTPYCHTIHGTTCTAQVGAKRSCTDVCGNNLSCTCTAYAGKKYWWCQYEC